MTDPRLRGNLDDPTTVIVTDGSPEAETSVMRERLRVAREQDGAWPTTPSEQEVAG